MYRVEVMMSTFNGEQYIYEQIKSIMDQREVDIHLTIRDDGSSDLTKQIVYKAQYDFPDRISLFVGENLGYRRSFLSLLALAQEADYYCFADQDDVWLPEKTIKGINKLENEMNGSKLPALYASSVIFTDKDLKQIGKSNISNMPTTIESYFTRSRIPGCTYIFNNQLMKLVKLFSDVNLPSISMPDHDNLVGGCAILCGRLILDNDAYILHRRHGESVTNGGTGIIKRIKTEFNIVFNRKDVRYQLAKLYLERIDRSSMHEFGYNFINEVSHYKDSLRKQIRFLTNKKMTSNIMLCDLETKAKIVLRNY